MGTTTLCEACQKNEMNVVEASDEPKQPYHLAVLRSPFSILLTNFYCTMIFMERTDRLSNQRRTSSSPKVRKHQHYTSLGMIWRL
ncbi:hypothetical protein [Bacillus safensis]|uniref:hypothetical protein n=1 Tax=Bacillus safensis TaxID=561879 RepID=UPI00215D5997|nr:hypothetical protein [Bacillus safensis]